MKILMIIPYYVPAYSYGGPVTVVKGLAEHLVMSGNKVTVLTTDVLDNDERIVKLHEVINGVEVIRFRNISNNMAKNYNLYLPIGMTSWLKSYINNYDLVHCHDFFTWLNYWACFFCRKYKVPYILQPHGCLSNTSIKSRFLFLKKLLLSFFKKTVQGAKFIIALAEKESDEIKTIYEECNDNICIIPNGIEISQIDKIEQINLHDRFNIPQKHKIIIYLGRIQYIKGLDISIQALANLKDKLLFTFLIVGPDEGEKPGLIKLIEEKGLSNKVIFTGILSGENKIATLKGADLFLLNSRSEGFGMTIIEACASNIPVLISNNCPIVEIELFQAGRITSNSIKDVSNNLNEMLENDDLLLFYKKNTRKVAEYYSLESSFRKILALYDKSIS